MLALYDADGVLAPLPHHPPGPGGLGLVTIYHPWESGSDNSPRWDEALDSGRRRRGAALHPPRPCRTSPIRPIGRPTPSTIGFLWLIELLKQARYNDDVIRRSHPFQVKDVVFSAILSAANHRLAEIGRWLGRPADEVDTLRAWAERTARGVLRVFSKKDGVVYDFDLRTRRHLRVKTWAGLAPLLVRDAPAAVVDAVVARLEGPDFAGALGLTVPAVPSTTPGSPGFDPRSYWRGPIWPFANWLLWYGLTEHARPGEARRLREAILAWLRRPSARFAEYFEPYTGEPLGSLDQSWTAAVALDWLAQDDG